MLWIAPFEKDSANAALEKRLWDAADKFRANSCLKSQEYSAPVLGLEGEIKHGGNIKSFYYDPPTPPVASTLSSPTRGSTPTPWTLQ